MGMNQQLPSYVSLGGMGVAFGIGGTLLKLYVASDNVLVLMAAMAAYMLGNGFLIILLKAEPLAAAMTLSSCTQILVMAGIGYCLGDRLTRLQWVGIALCITAMWLLLMVPADAPRTGNDSLDSNRTSETAPKS